MAFLANWQAFRKHYIDAARHGDYRSALREVSAGWAVTKQLQAEGLPGWRVVAQAQMQTRIDDDIRRRAAEVDRLAAMAREQDDTNTLFGKDGQIDIDPDVRPAEAADFFWRGGWKIGGRGDNVVAIWLRLDGQGNVTERRVVKSTAVTPGQWVDITRWSGPDLRDVENRQHMDYVIHKRLCEVPDGGQNFVRVRGYRNVATKFAYQTTQDYCDSGDLVDMRIRHPGGIPEPLIWRILEQLAKAAIVSGRPAMIVDSLQCVGNLLTLVLGDGTRQSC